MKEKKRKDDIEKLLKEKKSWCNIVWGKPGIIETIERPEDDFVFPGKSPEKTIHIPFTAIHCKLAESNSIMLKNVEDSSYPDANHLVAHIMFVVSKQTYIKNMGNEKQEYKGGRMFIDFPIIGDYRILQKIQEGSQNSASYNNVIKENKTIGIGQYYYNRSKTYEQNGYRGHSEERLIDLLQNREVGNNEYIKNMVSCLKGKIKKLHPNYDSSSGQKFKIYAVNLFINSENNICRDCEKDLYSLMTSQKEDSFLYILKNELCNVDNAIFETIKNNNNFPYMFVSVSASKHTDKKGCKTFNKIDAELAFNGTVTLAGGIKKEYNEEFLNLSIDIKDFSSNKLILSTTVKWLYSSPEEYSEKYEKINSTKNSTNCFYDIKLSNFRNLNLNEVKAPDDVVSTTTTTREALENEKLVQKLTQENHQTGDLTDSHFDILSLQPVLLPASSQQCNLPEKEEVFVTGSNPDVE
ncbi:hypothetical protein [Rickettsia endosymbiont of Ceutorhynchus obstrictus]|uniref:hypothetical protein n=1 Tax=Rickettsia endosymbiont of Ceutorhynchus obstrictus TaxID=3066249 RepID=UPI003132ABA8